MDEILAAYDQLKNDPSLVFISGKYGDEDGIWAWESYTTNRFRDTNNGKLKLTLCFVPSRVSGIAINFYQYYVPATLDRVPLIAFDPTRNITGVMLWSHTSAVRQNDNDFSKRGSKSHLSDRKIRSRSRTRSLGAKLMSEDWVRL